MALFLKLIITTKCRFGQGTIVNVAVSNSAMFSDFNFVDYVVIFIGVVLCLKRVAQMERYHNVRVIILTSIFGVILVLFLCELGSMFDESQYDCTHPHYCQTEM